MVGGKPMRTLSAQLGAAALDLGDIGFDDEEITIATYLVASVIDGSNDALVTWDGTVPTTSLGHRIVHNAGVAGTLTLARPCICEFRALASAGTPRIVVSLML